jgi:hypothetical protein
VERVGGHRHDDEIVRDTSNHLAFLIVIRRQDGVLGVQGWSLVWASFKSAMALLAKPCVIEADPTQEFEIWSVPEPLGCVRSEAYAPACHADSHPFATARIAIEVSYEICPVTRRLRHWI